MTPTGNAGSSSAGRRKLLGLTLGVLLAGPAYACGPDFPMTLLDRRDSVMRTLPEGVFDFEVARLVQPAVASFKPVEWSSWEDTDELRAKAEAEGLPEGAAATLADVRASESAPAALAAAAGLPRDVALYTAGAVAWNNDDVPGALQYFQTVEALPDSERRRRGAWASFMAGRAAALMGDSDAAIAAFERTRAQVSDGSADPLGLAVASYGEQARLLRAAGDIAGAVRLYAEQAAHSSTSGRNSLLFVARAAVKDPQQVDALLADATGTRLLLAFLYSRYNELIAPDPDNEYPSFDAPADGPRLLAVLDRISQAPSVPQPDRLAAIAYRAGRFEQAGRLAAAAQTPLAAWVRAKLALRAGELDNAAQAYAEAAKGFPADEHWGLVRIEGEEWGSDDLKPRCRVQGEAGTLALSRGDYLQALELLYAAADEYWADAAYVAERVVGVDELKAFVDRIAPQPAAGTDARASDEDDGSWVEAPPQNQLRALLARRLMREQRFDVAPAYFDDAATREQAQRYIAARKATHAWTRVGQARAWFEAAEVARWHGMELMGFEGDPDYFIWGGSYDLNSPISWDEDYNPVHNPRSDLKVEGPWTSDDERARVAASGAQPLQRFHYRMVAAGHAGKAADILPPRSQAFAAVLCEATHWLIDREPDSAQAIYRRYLREGPYVPWGASFGRDCPAPDFAKVEQQIRADWIRQITRWALWLGLIPLLLLGIYGARLWQRSRAGQRSSETTPSSMRR